jgi:nucleoside-diphosphate-sugar epimerase
LKILIAGGGGFIGSELLSDLKTTHSTDSIDFGLSESGKNRWAVDLTNSDEVVSFADTCIQYDVLIFLVGLAHAKGKGKDYPDFERSNFQTLVNLLSALKSTGKLPRKIIFSSTISVYGEKLSHSKYFENDDVKPVSPYAKTKLLAERFLLKHYKANSWILRLAPVYSSYFTLNIDRRTKFRNTFYKVGTGSKKLSLCNIDNIVASINGIINDDVPQGLYNISDTNAYSYADLLHYGGASSTIRIPVIVLRLIHSFGRMTNSIFLRENTIKLISDNTYPSDKLQEFINLPMSLPSRRRNYAK